MKIPSATRARLCLALGSLTLGACGVASSAGEPNKANRTDATQGGSAIVGLAGKCLHDDADGTEDGNKVQLWTCNGTDAQAWTYSGGALIGPGGKCLDVQWNDQRNNTIVQLWGCNGTSAQQWSFVDGQIQSAAGFCLNVRDARSDDGTQLEIYDCYPGAPSEQWSMTDTSGGGAGGATTVGTTTSSSSSTSSGNMGGGDDSTMPTGDLPGWHLIYTDPFDGTSLRGEWVTAGGFRYLGGRGYVANDHTSVHDGVLDMKFSWENTPEGYLPTTGWAMLKNAAVQQYGKYLVRLRADRTPSVAIDALLWPQNEIWPPEVDFFEDDQGGRSPINAFTHYDASNQFTWNTVDTDANDWHTFGVEWSPSALTFTLDGVTWAQDQGSGVVPSTPMWLGFNQVIFPGAEDPPMGEGHFLVDWVAVFEPAP